MRDFGRATAAAGGVNVMDVSEEDAMVDGWIEIGEDGD